MSSETATADFGAPPVKDLSAEWRALLKRSDRKGFARLAVYLLVLGATGCLVFFGEGWWLLPAMMLHGFVINCAFAPLHESVHYTAFKSRRLNEAVAWVAGTAIFWNATWYRYSHSHHHRFCQDPARDPELLVPKPHTFAGYVLRLLGLTFLLKTLLRMTLRMAFGKFEGSYVPEPSRWIVRRSVLAQLGVYAALAGVSLALQTNVVMLYWLGPFLLGWPGLRFLLLAEHTGLPHVKDSYVNTRTTLTVWPVNLIFWNMPFHTMHHVNPAVPFHALPKAHALLRDKVVHVSPGYWAFTMSYLRAIGRGETPPIQLPR